MAYVDKINAGGELRDIHDTAGRQMIAPIELTSTATAAHAEGEYFIYNDTLYEATSAIAVGGTITPNTNCTAVPDGVSNEFGGEISQLKSAIAHKSASENELLALGIETDRQSQVIDGLSAGITKLEERAKATEDTVSTKADINEVAALQVEADQTRFELAAVAADLEQADTQINDQNARLSDAEKNLMIKVDANDLYQVAYETDAAHAEIREIKDQLETKAEANNLDAIAAEIDIRMIEAERQLLQKADKNDVNAVAADCDLLRQHVTSETSRLDQKIITDENQISELFGDIADQNDIIASKVNKPSGNGTNGQVLKTNGDGTTDWTDPTIPTDEQIESAVTDWLDEHPEATTTVEDGSITMAKLDSDLQDAIANSTESQDTEAAISAMDISDSAFERCNQGIFDELRTVKRYEHKLRQYAGRFTSADGFGLLFFTDPHMLSGRYGATEYTMRSELESIGQVFRNTAAHICICGGDWQNEDDTLPEALWQLAKVPNEMRHYIGEHAYTIVGNHEGNGESAGQLMLTPEKMARLWYDSNDGWFYVDSPSCRIVMFDAGYSIRPLTNYQYREIDWFGKLLTGNQMEHIICIGHILGKTDGANLGVALTQMMDAFNRRDSIMINGETYDFSQCTGTVHFCLSGHYHADDNIVLNNIPIIFTDDYATSHAIDCCYADFNTATLYCDRIGYGADRTFAIIPTNGYKIND